MPLRHVRGIEVQVHSFLTSAVDGSEWLISRPVRFIIRKKGRQQLNRKLVVPQNQSGRCRMTPCPYRESKPAPSSSLPCRYTDYITSGPKISEEKSNTFQH
jgi:hypothetical protein